MAYKLQVVTKTFLHTTDFIEYYLQGYCQKTLLSHYPEYTECVATLLLLKHLAKNILKLFTMNLSYSLCRYKSLFNSKNVWPNRLCRVAIFFEEVFSRFSKFLPGFKNFTKFGLFLFKISLRLKLCCVILKH